MIKKILKYVAVQFSNPHGVAGLAATFIMNRLNQKPYYGILQNLHPATGQKTLDIGFGNGYLLRSLYKKHPSTLLYGIHISEDMLNTALKRNRQGVQNNKIILSVGAHCRSHSPARRDWRRQTA